MGYRNWFYRSLTESQRGLLVYLDAAGQVVWEREYAPPLSAGRQVVGGRFWDWSYQPDGEVTVLGIAEWKSDTIAPVLRERGTWLLQFRGLPAPWQPDYCARPPAAPRLTGPVQQPTPGLFVLAADSTTAPGPRYTELSLCTWDWGDGAPLDSGWVGCHQYLTTDPVRVRQCVTNNLFCQSCTDYFPLGPLGVGAAAADGYVTVWPNPAPEGRYAVRAGGAQRYEVIDAVGRRILAGAVGAPELELDLSQQAPGVYGLRLTWPDGRTITKKLLR